MHDTLFAAILLYWPYLLAACFVGIVLGWLRPGFVPRNEGSNYAPLHH